MVRRLLLPISLLFREFRPLIETAMLSSERFESASAAA
jgi:hypothetical protein